MSTQYTVYVHTNQINGKSYVGVTSMNPERRWANGNGYRKNKHFYGAICKYGCDNFVHIIYKNGLSAQSAFKLEKQLISDLRTSDPSKGYNLSTGGERSAKGINRFGERHPRSVQVYSPELDECFGSMTLAAHYAGTSVNYIRKCLDGEVKYAGRNPFTGLPVSWQTKNKEEKDDF